jgi:hypothetical protein
LSGGGIEMEDWNFDDYEMPKAHPYQLIEFLQFVVSEKGEDITVAQILNAFAMLIYEQNLEEE